jgi:glutamate--cysteine ligase catalytic subunit
MSALSASTPIHKSKLVDWDLRYNIICQSVDDRTKEERDPKSERYLPKSRYSGVSHYISQHEFVKDSHNDT